MSTENFIPELWSAKTLPYLDKALVYTNMTNADYEGEIKAYGDTVHINQLGDITTFSYTKNVDMPLPETLSDATQTLVIDGSSAFNFQIDSVDKAQQNPKLMGRAAQRAAYAVADDIDQYIANKYTGVHADNIVGLGNDTTPVVPTSGDMYEYFTQAGMLLDDANIPSFNRIAIIPNWMYKLALNSDDFTPASALGDAVKVSGALGEISGFRIFKSNNVPNTSGAKYKVMFGTSDAITFAKQFVELEAYKPERRFGDALKGNNVFGGKVVQDKAFCVMTANRS